VRGASAKIRKSLFASRICPLASCGPQYDDQTAFLSSSGAIVYANFITSLLPPDLLALTETDSFQARWREERDEMDFHEIGPFAKDPEAVNILRKIDSRLQKCFRSSAKAEAGTAVSSNSAVILLMRIAEFLQAGHATIDENPETAFGIFGTVMGTKDSPRLHFNSAEVRILNKIYGNIFGGLCQPEIKTTDPRKAPTKFAQKLLNLELCTTYWHEHMVDASHEILLEAQYTVEEVKARIDTFISKKDTLNLFQHNLPVPPQNPMFLRGGHSGCSKKIKTLQQAADGWDIWAMNKAFPMLNLP
jgi:hypothetical protein